MRQIVIVARKQLNSPLALPGRTSDALLPVERGGVGAVAPSGLSGRASLPPPLAEMAFAAKRPIANPRIVPTRLAN